MDRKAWTVVIVCIAALGLWQWAYVQYYAPTPEQLAEQRRVAEQAQAATATPAPVAETTAAPTTPPVAPTTPAPAAPSVPRETQTVTTGLANFNFVSDAGGIATVELLDHLGENGANVFLNIPEALPIGTLSEQAGIAVGGFATTSAGAPNEAVFVLDQPDGLQIRKTYVVSEAEQGKGNYTVNLTLDFTNAGANPVQRTGYFLSTGGAAPVHSTDMTIYTGFDWSRDGKATFTDVNWFNESSIPLTGIELRAAQNFYEQKTDNISWAASKNQYFVNILAVTEGDRGTSVWARRLDLLHGGDAEKKVFGLEGALGLPGFKLDPGQTKSWTFQIYSGPKDLGRLSKLGQGEQEVMHFGIFKWVSEILLYSMNALYDLLGNFAAAIIALTIIIKALLWPLQNKATDSMRRMAALSPKMTELREKYKDDPTKMNQELMKLYKDYGVNPFSGCFPMLIQIPIFFGFYSMLGTAIELRNSSFLWVKDLSQPDTVGHILGFPINILPLLMAATMLWQMQLTPKTGDAVQRRMFMFMPLIFILFAYNFASALSLYWTTQNIISVIQLYATRNKPLPVLEKKAVTQKKALEAGKGKKTKIGPMTPKEILDTMLGYLGFAVQIEEQPNEHGLVLQIYTSDADLLTGRNDETLEDIQYLLNRLLQAGDPKAPRVTVDVEHRRAMRNDRLVEKMRAIADLVKERGKPLQTEPLNAYDRWLVHQAFKDNPEIQSWSPDDSARMKRITLRLRKKENA